jgi:uncharacterized OB-fold protein
MESTTEKMELSRPTLVSGEACPTCGALVAPDQRYCVECGERQGAPRFTLPAGGSTVTTTTTTRARRRPTASASTTFVLGIATLLVAMAVGVLIGRSGSNGSNQANAPVRVVTVGGSGTTATVAATATPGGGAGATGGGGGKTKKTSKTANAPKGPKIVKIVKTPPPTVQLGQKGSGPGYKNGKFTGDFFGP